VDLAQKGALMEPWKSIKGERHSWWATINGDDVLKCVPQVCEELSQTIKTYQLNTDTDTDAFTKYTHKDGGRDFPFHGLNADILEGIAKAGQNGAPQEKRKGYLSILKPLHDKYTHAGFLGNWEEEKNDKNEKTYWLKEWMGEDGEREIGEGQLFKHVYSEDPGVVLLVKWVKGEQGSTIVHPKNRERITMDGGDVFVIPVRNGRECLALMVQAWPRSINGDEPAPAALVALRFYTRSAT
jgi:hypothetical protein